MVLVEILKGNKIIVTKRGGEGWEKNTEIGRERGGGERNREEER